MAFSDAVTSLRQEYLELDLLADPAEVLLKIVTLRNDFEYRNIRMQEVLVGPREYYSMREWLTRHAYGGMLVTANGHLMYSDITIRLHPFLRDGTIIPLFSDNEAQKVFTMTWGRDA